MSFTGKLSHYLKLSEEKWIITLAQKDDILALAREESSSVGFMKILSIIGAICIGLGVILIISSNWSEFPRFIQLILSIMLPIVSLWIWYYFTYVQSELKILWNAFTLLGWVLIWATIALIGQTYNLDGTVGSLLLMWFILSLPLVFVFKLKTLAVMSTALFYGVLFYYTTEDFFNSWSNEKYILAIFAVISGALTIASYILAKMFEWQYKYLIMPVGIISLKILFLVLFLGTIDDWFMFLWESFMWVISHNILFLGVIGFTMWWANKNHEILLRHATFIWIWIYIFAKYIELFSGYLQAGIFFIVTGFFIIGLVYSFIKINKYLERNTTSSL